MCALFKNLECQLMTFQLKGFSLCARASVLAVFFYFEKKGTNGYSLHLTELG